MMNADLTPPPSIVVPAEVAPPTKQQIVAALDHVDHERHPDDHPEKLEVSSPDIPFNNSTMFPNPIERPWQPRSQVCGPSLALLAAAVANGANDELPTG